MERMAKTEATSVGTMNYLFSDALFQSLFSYENTFCVKGNGENSCKDE
jgi:hypothetical protein